MFHNQEKNQLMGGGSEMTEMITLSEWDVGTVSRDKLEHCEEVNAQ
jgi:hypothetical protein